MDKSTGNKNDVRCNARVFSVENKANSVRIFAIFSRKQIDGSLLWSI